MIKIVLLTVVIVIVFYGLYMNGLLIINSKRAVMYMGSKGGKKASFISCTGYTKRVVRFRESKKYQFDLRTNLSKGDVTVELSESGGRSMIQLDQQVQSGEVTVEKERCYCLIVRFQAASGNYELEWN